ncbi:transposase [Lutispora thermophila DSM 19022]|uniref:Transposase n=1 Tax=Lutispora thermophila DSM 19022 TaxID=1122184 RepID=A0A1M6IZ79_9FIRM|nr:transposase [Lutispora thermophila DSM 19022]
MTKPRKKYTAEFKQEIIKLITEQGKTVTEVARSIDVHEGVISRLVKEYKADNQNAFSGKGNLKPEDKELRDLKKKIYDLEEENAILKKAVAIFTRPTK